MQTTNAAAVNGRASQDMVKFLLNPNVHGMYVSRRDWLRRAINLTERKGFAPVVDMMRAHALPQQHGPESDKP
jgi:hypothetical protein